MDNSRFDRLEQKIDKLTDAVTQIARVEEKIMASNMRLDRAEQRIEKAEQDIDDITELARQNSGVVKFVDKMFWLVIGGFVSLTVWFVRSGIGG
jgi:hypothetical protein